MWSKLYRQLPSQLTKDCVLHAVDLNILIVQCKNTIKVWKRLIINNSVGKSE